MNALVTGGAGFIGSNIVKLLLEHKYNVTVCDNLTSGNISNISNFINNKQIKFIEIDILDKNAINNACKDIDAVFHLAASVGRQKSIDNPIEDASTNLLGTINILESMRNQCVGKIIYSSSAAIYGELLTPIIAEDHPLNADSPYGVTKLAGEKMILSYASIYNIKAVCLRYFNIYGINQRFDLYGNVIPIFAKKIYSNEPITIYGDGEQTRDFLNVRDVANANYMAYLYDGDSDCFNLGSGYSITINDLARIMIEISGKNTEIIYAPMRPADVLHCKANTQKAKKFINFNPTVELIMGLKEYMNWFENNCI